MKLEILNEKDREAVAVVLLRNGYTVSITKKIGKQAAFIEYNKGSEEITITHNPFPIYSFDKPNPSTGVGVSIGDNTVTYPKGVLSTLTGNSVGVKIND